MGLRRVDRRARSQPEIVADILLAALDGDRKTHIMYKANLSFRVIDYYLPYLTKIGLVMADTDGEERAIFRTTPRGKRFISRFMAMKILLDGKPDVEEPSSTAAPGAKRRDKLSSSMATSARC